MADKLIFRKKTSRSYTNTSVRINGQLYDMLANISEATGMSISAVANKMIEFASQNTDIIDTCPATNINCCFSCSDTR